MPAIEVQLHRLYLAPEGGPGSVRVIVSYMEGFRIDATIGYLTDAALRERLEYRRAPEEASRITSELMRDPGEMTLLEQWPTIEHAMEHWKGGITSPIRPLTWNCGSGHANRIDIGARVPDVAYLRCEVCREFTRRTIESPENVGLG